MKTLYLDCSMGAAGDMLTAALLELLPNPNSFVDELNRLFAPKVKFDAQAASKCGITGTHMSVLINGSEEDEALHDEHHHHHDQHEHHHEHHHHSHSSLESIEHKVSHLDIPSDIKEDIISVYKIIAEAESKVHGVPVSEIHFHEVGTLDAIADITAVCMLINKLSPQRIIASPVHVGSGTVECAHGILPVPAPATAHILKDIPVYSNNINGELCTPTGAALLKHFVNSFGDMPVIKINSVGYGMGKKDFPVANCLRAILGESEDKAEAITELICNVDDMTAEEIAFACECFFEGGAKDVFAHPVSMKKGRIGTQICVLSDEQSKKSIINLIFRHTTTLGIRENKIKRHTLERESKKISTPYGDINIKRSRGYGSDKSKAEFEDLKRIAKEQNISLFKAKKLIK